MRLVVVTVLLTLVVAGCTDPPDEPDVDPFTARIARQPTVEIPRPPTVPRGQRSFSQDDVDRLARRLVAFVERGIDPVAYGADTDHAALVHALAGLRDPLTRAGALESARTLAKGRPYTYFFADRYGSQRLADAPRLVHARWSADVTTEDGAPWLSVELATVSAREIAWRGTRRAVLVERTWALHRWPRRLDPEGAPVLDGQLGWRSVDLCRLGRDGVLAPYPTLPTRKEADAIDDELASHDGGLGDGTTMTPERMARTCEESTAG